MIRIEFFFVNVYLYMNVISFNVYIFSLVLLSLKLYVYYLTLRKITLYIHGVFGVCCNRTWFLIF
jgi:hypothetical protein